MSLQEQQCPACGLTEAAGAYCSACLTPTLDHWRPTARSEAQEAAMRVNAHRRAERAAASKKTANPAAVA